MQFSHQQGQGYQQPQFKQQSLTIIKALQLQQHQMEVRHLVVLLQLLLLQLKLHLLHQVIYTQPANVLGMYMTELVVKSVVLGEMLITGRVQHQQLGTL